VIYIGIDPGLSGALVAITPTSIEFHDMPVFDIGTKQQLDYANLAHILRQYSASGDVLAAIEFVAAMPGQGVSSTFKFGQCYGAALGILAALKIPYQTVAPVKWKRAFKLVGCEKDESRQRALELFPDCVAELRLKKHHGRADALLMARWLAQARETAPIPTP
jgi:crossover junction endodeoxyribonuclease RuvC